jgi:short-subunit dehydrogenase
LFSFSEIRSATIRSMFDHTNLTGARIILTGASSGIGWELAKVLGAARARLALAARSAEKLHTLAQELIAAGAEAVAIPTDITDRSQRQRLLDETVRSFGGVDILINNAGAGATGLFQDATEKRLRDVFEINFFGSTELTRLAIPHLLKGRQPMIVNVSSVIGRRAIPGYTDYCSSKFAMCGWSEALRAELHRQGIHVLLVNPGLIETPFREHLLDDQLKSQGKRPRAMPADRCARIMLRAMQRRKNEIVITGSGKLLLWVNRLFPRLIDWAMVRYAKRMMGWSDEP